MNDLITGACPAQEDLLLALEGELPPLRQVTVSLHLRHCVACQSTLAAVASIMDLVGHVAKQLGSGSGDKDEGADARYDRFLVLLHARKQQRIHRPVGWPVRARRWLPMAAVMPVIILAFLLSDWHSVTIEADELVQKAAGVERARPTGSGQHVSVALFAPNATATGGRRVPTFTRQQETIDGMVLTSAAVESGDSQIALLTRVLARHHFNWDQPLNMVSFTRWRSALPTRHDQVIDSPGSSERELRTTTIADGELREVRVTFERDSYRVTREVFVFDQIGTLEIAARTSWIPRAAPTAVAPVTTTAAIVPTDRAVRTRVEPIVRAPQAAPPDLSRWLDRKFGDTAARATFMPDLRRLTASVSQRLDALQDLSGRFPGANGPQSSPAGRARFQRQLDLDYQKLREDLDTLRVSITSLTLAAKETRHLWASSSKQDPAPADWSLRVETGLPHAAALDRLAGELRGYDDLPPAVQLELSQTFDALWSAIFAPSWSY